MTKHERIRKIEKAVSRVTRLSLIYSYGGGRGGSRMTEPPSEGHAWTDCSGFAQWLCQVGGIHLDNYVGSTWSLATEGQKGTSDYLTFFIKNNPGDEHVIIRLRRRRRLFGLLPRYRWAECGGSDNPKAGAGPTWFRPTRGRIAEFPIHRHFKEFA